MTVPRTALRCITAIRVLYETIRVHTEPSPPLIQANMAYLAYLIDAALLHSNSASLSYPPPPARTQLSFTSTSSPSPKPRHLCDLRSDVSKHWLYSLARLSSCMIPASYVAAGRASTASNHSLPLSNRPRVLPRPSRSTSGPSSSPSSSWSLGKSRSNNFAMGLQDLLAMAAGATS
jgi:hypothetical protein